MRTYKLVQIDSFTETIFGGNPAAIVFGAETLSTDEMKKIAREMNLSETAFVLPSTQADYRFRFFTPSGYEIPFCGHATVAALKAMEKVKKFKIEVNLGIIEGEVNQHQIILESPKIDLVNTQYQHKQIADAMGINVDQLDSTKPIMMDQTTKFLFLTAADLNALGEMHPSSSKTAKFTRQEKIELINIMTTETVEPDHHVHSRSFAPAKGINEDPMTGSAQGGIFSYLKQNKMLPETITRIGSEQGHFIHRPSFVEVELTPRNTARLYAKATPVFKTEINLP